VEEWARVNMSVLVHTAQLHHTAQNLPAWTDTRAQPQSDYPAAATCTHRLVRAALASHPMTAALCPLPLPGGLSCPDCCPCPLPSLSALCPIPSAPLCCPCPQVVERLEDIAADLLHQQQAEAAAAEAAAQQEAAADANAADAAAAPTAAQADAAGATPAGDQQQQQQQQVYSSRGGLARALAAASMVSEPPHLERLHTLSHSHTLSSSLQQQLMGSGGSGAEQLAASLQAQGVPAYQVLIENEDDPVTARAVAATLGHHFDLQGGAAAAAGGGGGKEEQLAAGAAAAGVKFPLLSPNSSRPSSATSSPRVLPGGADGGGGYRNASTTTGSGSTPICIARSMSRRTSHDIPLAPPSPGPRGSLGEEGSDKGTLAAAAPAPAGWYVAPAQSFKKGGVWLGPVRTNSGGLTAADVELHQDGPLTSLGDGPGVSGDARGVTGSLGGDPFAAVAGGELGAAAAGGGEQEQQQGPGNASTLAPTAAAAGGGVSGGGRASDGSRSLRRASTMKRLGADMLAAANVLSKALSAFSTASQQVPGLITPTGVTPGTSTGTGCDLAPPPPQLLLTQDLIRAAHNLSEALAAVLPSAAAMAGEPEDAAAPASHAAKAAAAKLKAIPSGTELHLAATEESQGSLQGSNWSHHHQQQQQGAAGGGIFRHHSVPAAGGGSDLRRHGYTPSTAAAASAVPLRSYRGFSWSAGDATTTSSSSEAARRLLSAPLQDTPAAGGLGRALGAAAGAGDGGAAAAGGAASSSLGGRGASWGAAGGGPAAAAARRSFEQVRSSGWEAGAAPQQQPQQQGSPGGEGGVHLLRMPSRRGRSLDL
jgi:hypothetical protein